MKKKNVWGYVFWSTANFDKLFLHCAQLEGAKIGTRMLIKKIGFNVFCAAKNATFIIINF